MTGITDEQVEAALTEIAQEIYQRDKDWAWALGEARLIPMMKEAQRKALEVLALPATPAPEVDEHVQALLLEAAEHYPSGAEWLDRKLSDVTAGRSSMVRNHVGGELAGALIYEQRPTGQTKICTVAVAEKFRRKGIATGLMRSVPVGVGGAYVTVSEDRLPVGDGLFEKAGFKYDRSETGVYAPDWTEHTFVSAPVVDVEKLETVLFEAIADFPDEGLDPNLSYAKQEAARYAKAVADYLNGGAK